MASQMYVLKRSGEKQDVKFDAITQRLQPLCEGLDSKFIDPVVVTQKVIEGFFSGDLHGGSRCPGSGDLCIHVSEASRLLGLGCTHRHLEFA
mmetsp:Transcript_42565/g.101464  ORF Transcript_42565/g.101464 Transcript_42565/m.101464 type:complete len:92 (+) Transcript_42565:83-358(+)